MDGRRSIQLDSRPSLTALYARAVGGFGMSTARRLPVLGALPGLSLLPGLERRSDTLPEIELELSGAEIDARHLHRYQQVCGFELSDRLPITYPHLLAFPLSMQLMTRPSFPFSVIGMVHIENRITQHRPLLVSEALDLRVWAQDLRGHHRGTQFDICAEIRAGSAVVWESQSTYLRFGEQRSGQRRASTDTQQSGPPEPDMERAWEVPDDIGRRYGEISGDRNPIHMHPLAARVFGMPRAIAHGMWVKARCLAALEGHEPGAVTVQASFKSPLLLPSRVLFCSWAQQGERHFAVRDADGGKPHLSGRLQSA